MMAGVMNGEIDTMYNYANPIDADVDTAFRATPISDSGESDSPPLGCYLRCGVW